MIRPVVLCGGHGSRLWPLSRKSHPKQFASFFEGRSLLQATLGRLRGLGAGRPLLLTANDYRFVVGEHLATAGVEGDVIVEPAARNTAPALAAAALLIERETPGAVMLATPSDHVIRDDKALARALATATEAAEAGSFVTFGVRPVRAETGYGYIELEGPAATDQATPFKRFVEKPDHAAAEAMVADGRHLWNSGMFVFPTAALIEAFEAHAPGVLAIARAAVENGARDLDFFRLGPVYAEAEDISIDYAIMEKVAGTVVALDGGWNDLGSWKTVWQESDRDGDGVATTGDALALDCEDTLLRAEEAGQRLVGLGLKNVVAVSTRDAVLVADIDRSQEVKLAVETLRAAGVAQADEAPRCHRPWGWYETLVLGSRFQVKQIMVKPGGALSLQSHHHRAEHWIVVAGTAKVTIGGEERLVSENQSVYIPLGSRHRLENPGKVEMRLIEVQTGAYLGEDDIIRYEDIYARG